MNIDTMEAGREIDTLMAEMMGWTCTIEDDPANTAFLDANQNYYIISDWLIQVQRGTLFMPSRSEDSAGIVADWLVAQGLSLGVFTGRRDDKGQSVKAPDGKIVSSCVIVLGPGNVTKATADTRPLAICRAALKARERWGE